MQPRGEGSSAEEISLAGLMMLSGTVAEQALEVVLNKETVKEAEDRPSEMKKEAMGEAMEAKGENSPGGIRGEVWGAMDDVSMAEAVSAVEQRPIEGEAGDGIGVDGGMLATTVVEELQKVLAAERR